MLAAVVRVLAGLWAGSLCTICGIVAPALFATLDDRRLAGELAGRFFEIATWLGVAFALPLLGIVWKTETFQPKRAILVLVALTAYAPLQVQLGVVSMMDAARASGDMQRFGLAHSLGSALFLAACVGTLGVSWVFNRRAG